jgi:superoxide reductase
MKHFVCRGCGNLVATINYSGIRLLCCAGPLDEVVPNSVDASREKHLPVLNIKDGEVRVTVGPADNQHPMQSDHAVAWVCLVTDRGSQRKILSPNGKAEAVFRICEGERVLKVFAYCNIHGLWVTELSENEK